MSLLRSKCSRMVRSQVLQYSAPGGSSMMSGMRRVLPVCISVSASKPSSSVPKPPAKSTMASEFRMKVSLRVKKYLKVMSFLSFEMTGLADCSQGSRMFAPKLFSSPAPSCPACMMPGPAPVMTIQPWAAIFCANSTACWYSALVGSVRAEPNIVTFRFSA